VSLKLVSDGEGESPFDALLAAAERDPSAAEGLALAYASLGPDERAALLETIVHDARSTQRSPSSSLALLLAVEDEPRLAERIAAALREHGTAHLARSRPDAAWAWGGDGEGGVVLARHLHGAFVEVFGVRWSGGAFELRTEPLASAEQLAQVRARLGVPEHADALGPDDAVDRLASVLWRARRRGPLPEALRRLEDLFQPYPRG
jgi:hypothetical protein